MNDKIETLVGLGLFLMSLGVFLLVTFFVVIGVHDASVNKEKCGYYGSCVERVQNNNTNLNIKETK